MTRLLGSVLILCAQVFAALAPGTVVVCAHADGTSRIELVGALCCDVAHEAAATAALDAADARHESGPTIDASGDDCRDTPLRHDQATVARSTVERACDAAHEPRSTSPAAVAWATPARFVAAPTGRHESVPRPPGTVPRRPVVVPLRI